MRAGRRVKDRGGASPRRGSATMVRGWTATRPASRSAMPRLPLSSPGDVDLGVLDDLVALCLQLANHGAHRAPQPDADPADEPAQTSLEQLTATSREAIRQAIIGKAIDLLSGPGGLASFLRRRQLGVRLAGPSLPLDVGYSEDVPAGIRKAVRLRDQHCRFPGGCFPFQRSR